MHMHKCAHNNNNNPMEVSQAALTPPRMLPPGGILAILVTLLTVLAMALWRNAERSLGRGRDPGPSQ